MSQRAEEPMKALQEEGLDALLEEHFQAAEVQLTPTSGFLQEVMFAVTQDAAAPERIRFPWRRVLAGVAGIMAVLCGWGAHMATHAAHTMPPVYPLRASFTWTPVGAGMACAGTALLLSFGTLAIALRSMGTDHLRP